ncbi:MAG TPA: hypothetical protein VG323_02355 [Thermoanaerobaculia bacterium]|nr:hypothetical protein [Thermoanaerobaculia bacterium]
MDVTRGRVYPENQILLASNGRNPAIASDGENVLVVWTTDITRPRRPRLHAALVGRGGIIGAPFVIAEADAVTAPAAAWNGTNYVIAWHDPRERGLRTASVDRFGNFLGQVNDVVDATTSDRVSIATDGDRSLVVTPDSFVVIDRDALPLAQSDGGGNDVTWNGQEYFVVASDNVGVNGVRVSRDGIALGGPTTITRDEGHDPQVAWNGREIEVMWLVDGPWPFRPSVRFGWIGADGVFGPICNWGYPPPYDIRYGDEIWNDRWIYADNFDLAARTTGQTIIAKGPAVLVTSAISFVIMTPRRRAAGN